MIDNVKKLLETSTGDVKTGVRIVIKALEEPIRQIAANAGQDGSVIVEKVKNSPVGQGFDVLKEAYVDMIEAGIVDPAKVTRAALQNAASVAAMLLTTEAVVADIPEPEPPMPAGGGGGCTDRPQPMTGFQSIGAASLLRSGSFLFPASLFRRRDEKKWYILK